MYRGNTSNVNNTPPRRAPTVSAAPMAPMKTRLGVPSAIAVTKIASPSRSICSIIASTGAANSRGAPVSSQLARHLASTTASSDSGVMAMRSRLPSSKSDWNMRSSDNRVASNAATQTTAAPMRARIVLSGPTLRGNKVTVIRKNMMAMNPSPP